MNHIQDIYKNQYLYIFQKDEIKDLDTEYLVVVKDDVEIQELENCKVFHYSDDFEQYLIHQIPTKIRKKYQILSYEECYEILKRIEYGTCTIMGDEYPYSFPINHILYENRIFFHTALSGYKLKGLNQPTVFNVVEDLRINKEVGTHNHRSVSVYGYLRQIQDDDLKREVLLKLVHDLAPAHPYHDRMLKTTNILEVEIDYLTGKEHIR